MILFMTLVTQISYKMRAKKWFDNLENSMTWTIYNMTLSYVAIEINLFSLDVKYIFKIWYYLLIGNRKKNIEV